MNEMDVISRRNLRDPRALGFTLVEVVVVLVILVTIAAFVTNSVANVSEGASADTTRISLGTLRDVIVTSYRNDLGRLPTTVGDLERKPISADVFDPRTRRGWRGPYVRPSGASYVVGPVGLPNTNGYVDASFTAAYGSAGDPAVHDGYARPIVLQVPDLDSNGATSPNESRLARLVSAGIDRVIDTPRDVDFPSLAVCDDDLVLYLEVADSRAP